MTETTITLPYVFQSEVLTRLKILFTLLGVAQTPVPPNFEAETLAGLDQLINFLQAQNKPARIVLGPPIDIRNGKLVMANLELPNDVTRYRAIFVTNISGVIEPAIPGDVYSVTIGSPATQSGTGAPLNAVIGAVPATLPDGTVPPDAGAVALVYNALNATATGIDVKVSDLDGLKVFEETVDIVVDATPKNIVVGAPVDIPQPVPAV